MKLAEGRRQALAVCLDAYRAGQLVRDGLRTAADPAAPTVNGLHLQFLTHHRLVEYVGSQRRARGRGIDRFYRLTTRGLAEAEQLASKS